MKRRIAHVHTGRNWGGGECQVLDLVRDLVRRGEQAVLFTVGKGKLFRRSAAEGLKPQAVSHEAIVRMEPDIIHAHDSGALSISRGCARERRVPVVLSRRIASPLRRNPFSRAKYSAGSVAAVIAISETVKHVFAASGYPADRIHVVPDGLDFEVIDAVAPDPELRRNYRAEFLVAGIGSLDNALDVIQMIKETKIDGKTILYPHIKQTPLQMVDHWDKQQEIDLLNDRLN